MRKIIKAIKRGWVTGGIQWREEFYDSGLNPEKYSLLPEPELYKILVKYSKMSEQQRTMFRNIEYRKRKEFRL